MSDCERQPSHAFRRYSRRFKLVPSETHAASYPSKTFEQIQAELGAHTDTHTTCEKENGWIQTRTMTTSTALIDTAYAQWPGVAQIYEYKTERTHTRTGKKTQMTQYGITSLTPEQASAERLMTLPWALDDRELVPSHAGLVFHEDASQVRCGGFTQ